MVDLTVSVCHLKHIEVWRAVQENLRRFVPADVHLLVVPDENLREFREVTGQDFCIEPESLHTAEYADALRNALARTNQSARYGWYVQQFIKIGALRGHPDDTKLVIWDADTVPLRPIDFFSGVDAGAKIGYFSERMNGHGPMFAQIESLLGLVKATKRGFIAQCFPLWGEWANEFFREVEGDGENSWHARLIDSIPFERGSALSEYELLGTFLATRHPDKIFWNEAPWIRNGFTQFSGPQSAVASSGHSQPIHFAAFEEYDRDERTTVSVTLEKDFETTSEWLTRFTNAIIGTLSSLERMLPSGSDRSRLFVGLPESLHSFVSRSPELCNAWSSATLVDPSSRTGRLKDDGCIRGIPGSSPGRLMTYRLDADQSVSGLRLDVRNAHPSGGRLVALSRADLAIRFWAELVEWDQDDEAMRPALDEAFMDETDVLGWSELPIDAGSFVLVDLAGFETQVIGTLVAAMESDRCARPCILGFVTAFRDEVLDHRLQALGYSSVLESQSLDGFTPRLRSFVRQVP